MSQGPPPRGGRRAVDGPSVWTPRDFRSEDQWSYELTAEQIGALVAHGRGAPASVLDVALGDDVHRWAATLVLGAGFLRLRCFPLTDLTRDQIIRAYLGLGRLLGAPVQQDRTGGLVADIRDERGNAELGRRYQTNLAQDFHTDASDLVALLCIRPARTGGLSRIVSAHAVYNEMLRRAPELVDELYHPLPWSRHSEPRGGSPYFELAPITDVDSTPRIFLIPWYITQSQAHPSAPRLTREQSAALDLITAIASDPALRIEMSFAPGDIQILNNTTVLHARTPYEDHPAPERRRHLLRQWLSIGLTPRQNGLSLPARPSPAPERR